MERRLSDSQRLWLKSLCGELFVVGETLEQIASFIIGTCGEHFMAVEVISFTNICVRQRGWTKRESMFLILNETEIPE